MKLPAISQAEWHLMQAVWDRHPTTADEVAGRLGEKLDWHPRTVKTLLHRLVRKGALSFRRDGKRYLYSPRVRREECVRAASRSFLDRVFSGEAAPALMHFVEELELSPGEIEDLKALLDRKRGKRR